MADPVTTDAEIAATLMELATLRGASKSFCPSEAARALSPDWRPLMPRIRAIASELPLRATQSGMPVDAQHARGPIRLSLAEPS